MTARSAEVMCAVDRFSRRGDAGSYIPDRGNAPLAVRAASVLLMSRTHHRNGGANVALNDQLRRIRERFVNGTLVVISIVAVPALAASLSRIPEIGWLPAMGAHIALALVLFTLTFARNRIAYAVRAGYVVFLFFAIAAVGLANIGMIGGPYVHFAAAVIFAFVLFGARTGTLMIVLSIAALLGFFELTTMGLLTPGTDPVAYIASRSTWITAAAGLLLMTAGVGAAITLYQRQLISSLQAEAGKRARLDDLIDHAPDGILIANPIGQVLQANETAAAKFGYSAAEIIGARMEQLLPGISEFWPDQTADGSESHSIAAQCKDGTTFPAAVTLGRLSDPSGDTVVAMVQNMSAIQALQARVSEAEKLEAMGQLTGGMAHDFNNFLASIVGSLDLIDGTQGDPQTLRKHVERAKRCAFAAANLTNSLLAFAQRQPQKPRNVQIAAHLRYTADIVRPSLGAGVKLQLDAPDRLWPVKIDTGQFDSAILNLATNARDAMPEGGTIKIVVRNETVEAGEQVDLPAGDYVRIAVSDTGTGMGPDVAAKVFGPFFTTKEAGKGTGLGLSMVHGFAAQSGGGASLSSGPAGTTVTMHLPRSTTTEQPASATVPPAAEANAGPALQTGGSVLVVEDDEHLREVVATLLWAMGYDVIEAETGDLALPLLQDETTQIDLLFTDIIMEGHLDGIRLAKVARELRPTIPVVLTSGFPGDPGGLSELPDDIPLLRKPYPQDELAAIVRRALGYN